MKNLRVLVVDDAAFIRDLVVRVLKSVFPDVKVAVAENGVKAQQMMEKLKFHIILCDWEMPEMSGLELLHWVRSESGQKKVPFIMVTSRGDRDHVVEAAKEGVSDYIGKPFSNEQLTAKINKVLAKAYPKQVDQGKKIAAQGATHAGSVSALTSGPSLAQASVASKVKSKAAAKPGASGGGAVVSGKDAAQLRIADQSFSCQIEAVSLRDMKLVLETAGGIPALLEMAVVDLTQDDDEVARLNGYITSLQAVQKTPAATQVRVVLAFTDNDPQKMEYLSKLIASGTGKKFY